MPRRRRCRQLGALLPAAAAAALIAASNVPGVALAANTWTTTVTVQAVGESAVMPGGQSPSATIVQGAISVTWGPSTFQSGKEVAGYIVNRQTLGSTTVVQVCTVGGAESNVPGFATPATKRHVHRDSDGRIVAGSGLGAVFTGDVARPAGVTHAVGESERQRQPDVNADSVAIAHRFGNTVAVAG